MGNGTILSPLASGTLTYRTRPGQSRCPVLGMRTGPSPAFLHPAPLAQNRFFYSLTTEQNYFISKHRGPAEDICTAQASGAILFSMNSREPNGLCRREFLEGEPPGAASADTSCPPDTGPAPLHARAIVCENPDAAAGRRQRLPTRQAQPSLP